MCVCVYIYTYILMILITILFIQFLYLINYAIYNILLKLYLNIKLIYTLKSLFLFTQ